MQPLIVPSIFTATDKYSSTLSAMRGATNKFATTLDTVNNRSQRLFSRLTPGMSEASSQLAAIAGKAAIVAAAFAGVKFSSDSVMNYEDALQSFRTIVSDLSDKEFGKFEGAIGNVAKETKRSTIEVAQAFEKIAGLNSTFADTTEGISAVTKAAITLSKASRDELGVSAENLVGILNQFSLAATESDRTINVLAAGQAVGAASITQTSEAFKVFGAVAKQSNLSLEQSVALTEVLASKQIMGAEAGTALRGTLVRLKDSGLGYKSGLFNTRDALEEVNQKYAKLKTAKEKDALLDKVFGTINLTTGSILMENIKLYDKFTDGVTGTAEAHKAAEINGKTLRTAVDQLSASWVNLITSSDKVGSGLSVVKDVLIYVAEHMETIATIGLTVVGVFAAWKVTIVAGRAALLAYNIVAGVAAVRSASLAVSVGGGTAAQTAQTVATYALIVAEEVWAVATAAATGNMLALNAAMMANPIGAVILALVALAAATYAVYKAFDQLNKQEIAAYERKEAIRQEAFAVTDLRDRYLKLGETLKDAEKHAIRDEKVKLAASIVQAKLKLSATDEETRQQGVQEIETAMGKAQQLQNFEKNFGAEAGKDRGARYTNSMETGTYVPKLDTAGMQQAPQIDWLDMKPAINPKMAQANAINNTVTKNNNATATITVRNESGAPATVDSGSKSSNVMPGVTSTVLMSAK